MMTKSLAAEKLDSLISKLNSLGQQVMDTHAAAQWAVQTKENSSYVTDADFFVDDALSRFLPTIVDVPVFSEEHTLDACADSAWILDPIDGTSAFISGIPTWSFSVALMLKNKIVFGALYFPAFQKIYHSQLPVENFSAAQWPVSIGAEDFITAPSSLHHNYDFHFPGKLRSLGSCTMQILLAATGKSLFTVLGRPYLWDYATAIPMFQRAGVDLFFEDGSSFHTDHLTLKRSKLDKTLFAAPKNCRDKVLDCVLIK